MTDASIDQIKDTIRTLILEEVLWDEEHKELNDDANLLKIMDSLGITTLITMLEEEYEITISNDLLVNDNLESVGALARLVVSRLGAEAGAPS